MVEPGLDRHEWETEWQALEPGETVDPGDIGAAVAGYRNLYQRLIDAHPA
jgi:hypothetical protein